MADAHLPACHRPIMRIGQFSDSFPPIINGVSAFVAEHHSQLQAQGHDAHVFTFGYTRYRDTLKNVWRTPGLPIFDSGFRINLWLNRASAHATKALDVYHAHEPFVAGQQAMYYSRLHGQPFVYTNHTRHDMYIKNYPRIMQPFMRRSVYGWISAAAKHSVVATAPSEETAQLLRLLAPDSAHKVRVLRNGIRLDSFDANGDHDGRGEFGIGSDATLFMYVGRLTPEKNLPIFADALTHAVRNGANAHWVIIGDGPCREELNDRLMPIHQNAHFLGAVPRERVPSLLAMADVFATPSLSEVNPVSVIEALASGKPYLGLKAGWWDEFKVEPHNGTPPAGWLATNPIDLSNAIIALSHDAPKRRAMSVEARKLSHRFDIRDITRQWIDIYEEAIMRQSK